MGDCRKISNSRVNVIVVSLIILLVFFSMSGCSLNEIRFSISEDNYRESKLNTILDALQNEEASILKNLFSRVSIDIASEDEIQEGIEYIFTLYKGKTQYYDLKKGGVSESIRGNGRLKSTYIWAIVTTDVDVFDVYARDIVFDSLNPDNVGISNLSIMLREDVSKYGTPRSDFFGVYRPGQIPEQIEYGFGIEHHYITEYGSFTIPKEFYRNPIKSNAEKYVFFEIINTPDEEISGAFSIEAGSWVYGVNDTNKFMNSINPMLEDKLKTTFPGGVYSLEKTIVRDTSGGYPLVRIVASDEIKNQYGQEYIEAFYYIVGDMKYVEIRMSKYWRDEKAFLKMEDTALEIADSFVWAD